MKGGLFNDAIFGADVFSTAIFNYTVTICADGEGDIGGAINRDNAQAAINRDAVRALINRDAVSADINRDAVRGAINRDAIEG